MALIDKISCSYDINNLVEWANGKYGIILPKSSGHHVFVEWERIDGEEFEKYDRSEREEKCPKLTYGFVSFWLVKRKMGVHVNMETNYPFVAKYRIMTPKEIYDLYIDQKKTKFLERVRYRPDSWKYPEPVRLFYEKGLTVEQELNFIHKSEPLLEYLDEDDRMLYREIMRNFVDYVAEIVKPYQRVMEKDIHKTSLGSPNIEDLIAKSEQLESELASYNEGENSKEWHDLVKDTIEHFDKIMRPAGFYEWPKIRVLSHLAQCKLILKLLHSSMPYRVALLHVLDCKEQLEQQKDYKTQTARLRLLESALRLTKGNRELKGNVNVLKPETKENVIKYTSYSYLDKAAEFYNSLK